MADPPQDNQPERDVPWLDEAQAETRPVPDAAAGPAGRPAGGGGTPLPKPSAEISSQARTDESRALAETVVSSITDRLAAEARKRGGFLTLSDIDELTSEFRSKTEQLHRIFQKGFEQYVRARERAAFDHARQFPFDRVIVNTFAHLFSPDVAKAQGADRVSRRLLPGFFLAMDKMLGSDQVEEFHKICRGIAERLSPGDEQELNWDRVYGDPETVVVAIDALIAFAPYFEDYGKRRGWFMTLVNSNLTPPVEGSNNHPDAEWELSEKGFANLVDGLFLDLRQALADAGAREAMEARYGVKAYLGIKNTLANMDRARASA